MPYVKITQTSKACRTASKVFPAAGLCQAGCRSTGVGQCVTPCTYATRPSKLLCAHYLCLVNRSYVRLLFQGASKPQTRGEASSHARLWRSQEHNTGYKVSVSTSTESWEFWFETRSKHTFMLGFLSIALKCIDGGLTKGRQSDQGNSVAWVRERTIPTERPQLVGEVSENLCEQRVSRSQSDGVLRPY
jgi:hypothetical protein